MNHKDELIYNVKLNYTRKKYLSSIIYSCSLISQKDKNIKNGDEN